MILQDYFSQFTKALAYLDLKEEAQKKWAIDPMPMPIRVQDFIGGIQEGVLDQAIDYSFFVKGMVWNLGIDPDFKYADAYRELLERTVKEPDAYAVGLGMDALAGGKTEDALIAFRAAHVLSPDNLFALVHYGDLLWRIPSLSDEDQKEMVHQASHLLERALRLDEKSPLANTALGQINEGMGNYSKATAYYQRALQWTEDAQVQEEIRQAMEGIAEETAIESALYYMRRADYGRAADLLNKLVPTSHRYDIFYYLGLSYQNLGHFEEAAQAFQEAIDRGGDFEDLYNGWVYCLSAVGKRDQALAAASKGLDRFPSALRLRFNRAILLTLAGKKEEALEDLNALLSYDDLSDEFFSEVMTLREQISE